MAKGRSSSQQQASPPPLPDPYEIFQIAQAFLSFTQVVADRFPDELTRPVGFDLVGCVNQAFSLELHLKCLIVLEGKHFDAVHGLDDLFKVLEEDTRSDAERRYDKIRASDARCHRDATA